MRDRQNRSMGEKKRLETEENYVLHEKCPSISRKQKKKKTKKKRHKNGECLSIDHVWARMDGVFVTSFIITSKIEMEPDFAEQQQQQQKNISVDHYQ